MIGKDENVLSLRVQYTACMELSNRNMPSWRKEMKTEIKVMNPLLKP